MRPILAVLLALAISGQGDIAWAKSEADESTAELAGLPRPQPAWPAPQRELPFCGRGALEWLEWISLTSRHCKGCWRFSDDKIINTRTFRRAARRRGTCFLSDFFTRIMWERRRPPP